MTFPKSFYPQQDDNSVARKAVTAVYTVVPADNGTVIDCTSGTYSVFLTASAVLGNGFNVTIINSGTGVITVDPNGNEIIDASTTVKLSNGQGFQLVCDGSNFKTLSVRISGDSAYSTALGANSGGTPSIATAGTAAMALGGSYASGTDSFAAAVANNTNTYGAQGANSIALGSTAKATGSGATAIGNLSLSSSTSSIAIGSATTASANRAVAIGSGNTGNGLVASGSFSFAAGLDSKAALYGKYTYASGAFTEEGDVQLGVAVLRAATTNATPAVLTANAGAASTINQVILANNQSMTITGTVNCRQSVAGADKASGWTFTAVIRRGANAASTALVAAVTPVLVAQDVALVTTVVAVTADTTNGGLAITVTGIAATNLRWVAVVNSAECIYA